MSEIKKNLHMILCFGVLSVFMMGASIIPACNKTKDGGVFKSSDGGNTWEQKKYISEKENLNQADVTALAIDPVNTDVIYIGVKDKGLYKTIDGGDNWRRVLPRDVYIYAIAVDPKDPSIVYASSLSGKNGLIYKSPNGFEETVEEVLVEAQGGLALVEIRIDHYDNKRLFALSSEGGIFQSTDAGQTWSVSYWFDGKLTSMDMSPTDSRVIYVGTKEDGFLKSTDGGGTWNPIFDPLKSMKGAGKVYDVILLNSEIAYAATSHGLIKTTNGGSAWQEVKTLVQPGEVPVKTIALDYESPDLIYFATGSAVHKSTNGGKTWANWLLPSVRTISVLALDPKNPEVVYAGVLNEKK